jgi:hypothetical protein
MGKTLARPLAAHDGIRPAGRVDAVFHMAGARQTLLGASFDLVLAGFIGRDFKRPGGDTG